MWNFAIFSTRSARVSLIRFCVTAVFKDTGYPHDGCAGNAAYRHDRRADKRRYPHDREIDIQRLKCSELDTF